MDELTVSSEGSDEASGHAVRTRVDPRSGKVLTLRDASFWQEQEARRVREGLTFREYCDAHGLALSTLRRWSSMLSGRGGQRRRAATPHTAKPATPAQPGAAFLPIPIHQSSRSTLVEGGVEVVLGDDVRVTLMGAAAQRVLDVVLARPQAPR